MSEPGVIEVLFFSRLREVVGRDATERPWHAGVTVSALLENLFEEWPQLREWEEQILVAVNLEYAARDTEIPGGAEVAIMPPVQGG